MAIHHFTLLVTMNISTLPSTLSVRHIVVIHHVRTRMVTHRFTLACNHSHIDIVQYLLSNGKVNPLAKNQRSGKTPIFELSNTSRLPLLHLAARNGWLDIIKDIITKYRCDTNCKDSYGRTPLHYAATNDHLEVVKYFIKEQQCDPMTKRQ